MPNDFDTSAYPLGSMHPYVLYNNAGNEDLFVNDVVNETWVDRPPFNRVRKTIYGMEQEFLRALEKMGYETAYLTYVDGSPLQVDRPTQLITRGDSVYAVKLPVTFPVLLTGSWATDASLLVDVGDQSLRTELATPTGATMIGRGVGTVDTAIDALEASYVDINTEIVRVFEGSAAVEAIDPQRVAMHYGACRGTGFIAGIEPGGTTTTLTTASAAQGANLLRVASTASFFPGQLIVYLGTNGDYYSVNVLNKDASSILLRTGLEVAIASGAMVSNFYANESHANTYGYYAIADYALRSLLTQRQVMRTWRAEDGGLAVGGANLSSLAGLSYGNPGSTTVPSIRSIGAGVGTGIATPFYDLPAGNYVAKFYIAPAMVGSSDISVPVSLSVIERTSVADTTIQVASPRGQDAITVELAFAKRSNSTISFSILNQTATTLWSSIVKIEVLQVSAAVRTLDKGKHVLLGDSWFAYVDIRNRLAARLPNAVVVAKGVGGDTAAQLLARFNADVTPENPDFVWVMCGTNDVAQGIPLNTFGYNIGLIKSKIAALGARSIFFDCSVGSTAHSTLGDLLTSSRNFALGTDYLDDSAVRRILERKTEVFQENFMMTVPASSTRRVCVFPGTTTFAATLDRLYVVGQTATIVGSGNVRYGFGGSATTTISEDLVTAAFTTSVLAALPVAKTNASVRFLLIEIQNTSVSAIDIIGFVSGTWAPV